jgi:hypothetical protein
MTSFIEAIIVVLAWGQERPASLLLLSGPQRFGVTAPISLSATLVAGAHNKYSCAALFAVHVERKYGKARRLWIFDRGVGERGKPGGHPTNTKSTSTTCAGGNLCNSAVYFEAAGVAAPMYGNLGIEIARITVGESIDGLKSVR